MRIDSFFPSLRKTSAKILRESYSNFTVLRNALCNVITFQVLPKNGKKSCISLHSGENR